MFAGGNNSEGDCNYQQWRIQDFTEVRAPTLGGAPTYDFAKFSPKNCMKLKEFGLPREEGVRPSRPS